MYGHLNTYIALVIGYLTGKNTDNRNKTIQIRYYIIYMSESTSYPYFVNSSLVQQPSAQECIVSAILCVRLRMLHHS